MNLKKYKEELLILKRKHNEEIKNLQIEFVFYNNKFKVGSIFTDHIGSIFICKIELHIHYGLPSLAYIGNIINSKNQKYENGRIRTALLINQITPLHKNK